MITQEQMEQLEIALENETNYDNILVARNLLIDKWDNETDLNEKMCLGLVGHIMETRMGQIDYHRIASERFNRPTPFKETCEELGYDIGELFGVQLGEIALENASENVQRAYTLMALGGLLMETDGE